MKAGEMVELMQKGSGDKVVALKSEYIERGLQNRVPSAFL